MNHKITYFLISIILLRLLSFFTFEEIGINSIYLKVLMRLLADVAIIIPYLFIKINHIYTYNKFIIFNYILFLILAFLSLTYTSSITFSAIQFVMYLESFIFSIFFVRYLFMYTENPYISFLSNLFYSIAIITISCLISILFIPNIIFRYTFTDNAYRLGGYLMNPNELGLLIVIGLSSYFSVLYIKKSRINIFSITIILLLILALYLTHSRSSLIGFSLFIIFFLYIANYKKILLTILIFVFIPISFSITDILTRGGNIEDVLTMTGRLPFWLNLIEDALPNEFVLGYGFQRIFYDDFYASLDSYTAQMAHNSFLQLFLGLGVVGFIIGMTLLFFIILHLILEKNTNRKLLTLAIFVPIIINSITEFGIFGFYNFGVLFIQLLIIYITIDFDSINKRDYNNV